MHVCGSVEVASMDSHLKIFICRYAYFDAKFESIEA